MKFVSLSLNITLVGHIPVSKETFFSLAFSNRNRLEVNGNICYEDLVCHGIPRMPVIGTGAG